MIEIPKENFFLKIQDKISFRFLRDLIKHISFN
jgi:hypothetical protein